MRTYRRIAYEDRCQMYALRKAGKTQAEIGQALGFSQGTVSRELARNAGRRGYRFQQAQRQAHARQEQGRQMPRKLTGRVRRALVRKLRTERWSPEQLSFWLRHERGVALSHEWIYQMIWADKRAGGDLWRFLRRRGKQYTRRGAQHAGRGVIPYRIDIAERPAIVARKARLGDWEEAIPLWEPTTRGRCSPRHGASADTAARPCPYTHLRPRQRVCRTPTHCAPPAGPHLLCHALSRVGTQGEREHEWPDSGLLPKGDRLHYNSPRNGGEGGTPAQPPAQKIARLSHAQRGLSRADQRRLNSMHWGVESAIGKHDTFQEARTG